MFSVNAPYGIVDMIKIEMAIVGTQNVWVFKLWVLKIVGTQNCWYLVDGSSKILCGYSNFSS